MSVKALLSNEFVVLAVDALMHVGSVFVLGIVVIVACKLLGKGFVDAKLMTGLIIAGLLVAMRVLVLNNAHYLGGVDIVVLMAVLALVLYLTSLVLVYKLVTIPLLGTLLSSLVIVAAQLALAHYTPVLSLKLMPEGQRFAEYAGVSNEKTKALMEQAKNFNGESSNNIGRVLNEALAVLAFWSSEEEQKVLSKDLSSGVRFIQERRAYMASMTEDELAEYRAAMSSFMQEQGIDLENRYSLENLKNATPEDLQNLANFMKDMNKEYGFTDDLPEGEADPDAPPTLESIRQIAKNLRGVKIGGEGGEQFAGLLKDMMEDDEFKAEMVKVKGQIADLKANSGPLMETFGGADLEGMQRGLESATGGNFGGAGGMPSFDMPLRGFGGSDDNSGNNLFAQSLASATGTSSSPARSFKSSSRNSIDSELMDLVIFQETGYYPTYEKPTAFEPTPADEVKPAANSQPARLNTEPAGAPNSPESISRGTSEAHTKEIIPENSSNYFSSSELGKSLTRDFILHAPKEPGERALWMEVSKDIRIDAWFEAVNEDSKETVLINGYAYQAGERFRREHQGERYFFRFEGLDGGQVVMTALMRETAGPQTP